MELKNNNGEWLKPSESLSQKAVRSGIWIFALRITNKLLRLVRTVILARVLAPHDFGLMGIALLAMVTLETFSHTGFNIALIQKKENIDEYLDTAWVVQVIRGIILFGILLAAAPLVATFFNTPKAADIVRVIAIAELFKGFTNIGIIYFQKDFEFNKLFVHHISTTMADLLVAIPAALILRSVWALVFGLVASHFVGCIISYIISTFRPRMNIDWKKFRELFGFGRWVLGSSILAFLITQGDDAFVGKIIGVTALGLYQIAYTLSNLAATEISETLSIVTIPTYSKIQDSLNKLKDAYLKVLQVTAFISIPISGGIFILAPEFTNTFLGNKWMAMVPAIRALALAGLVRSIASTTVPVFYAAGKPRIETKWQMVRLLVLAALIYPFSIKWGILGNRSIIKHFCFKYWLQFHGYKNHKMWCEKFHQTNNPSFNKWNNYSAIHICFENSYQYNGHIKPSSARLHRYLNLSWHNIPFR
jgi:O-antigen/teichoic acid export membrane protein